jgi:hypothetical protein
MLVVGNYIENVKCESFRDSETNRIRVKPLQGQNIPTDIVIECSSKIRKENPVGTKFVTENVKVCKKTNGRIYLRAKDQMIYKI